MKKQDLIGPLAALALLLTFGLACNALKNAGGSNSNSTANSANSTNTASTSNTASSNSSDAPKTAKKAGIVSPDEPAEFTFTAQEIYKIYKDDKSASADDKYLDKVVAVKGRFKDIDTSKKDTSGGYQARLNAGGTFDWVSCSVDEEFKDDFAKLKADEMVTLKGLGERFWIGGPRFKHCVVATQ